MYIALQWTKRNFVKLWFIWYPRQKLSFSGIPALSIDRCNDILDQNPLRVRGAAACAGQYTVHFSCEERTILKQYLGEIQLQGNGSIHLRSFGQFNLSLWDDVLADFEQEHGKLTPRDIIMFNFGAWWVFTSRIYRDIWLQRTPLSFTRQKGSSLIAKESNVKGI